MNLSVLLDRSQAWSSSPRGQRVVGHIRTVFTVLVIGYLIYGLTDIGWGAVLQSLPTQPLFYVLFLVLYFNLPFVELAAYRLIWSFSALASIPVFLKKRIFNKDVAGYTGEVYFYSWAVEHIGHSRGQLLKGLRDQNVLSAAASTSTGVLMLLYFVLEGAISLDAILPERGETYLVSGCVTLIVAVAIVLHFRKHPFSIARKTALLIFGLHFFRMVFVQLIQILQWAVALPEITWATWFTYAAVQIVISRIPILPNRDLIFLSTGVGMSQAMDVPAAEVASVLLVSALLGKALNVVLLAAIPWMGGRPRGDRETGTV